MRRLLLNGSPRGRESNSRLVLSWIAEGLGEEAPILDLARTADLAAQRQAFLDADEVILALPLYTDHMPGLVKGFLESLVGADTARLAGKRVAFVVQCGFPEAIHCETLAAYLERLARRLGFVHLGTLVKPGLEGVRTRSPRAQAKLRGLFVRAGRELAAGRWSRELAAELAGRRTFEGPALLILRLLVKLGLINGYWNRMLRQHRAYERRFDAPYGPPL